MKSKSLLLALAVLMLGVISPLAFAPYRCWWLMPPILAGLILCVRHESPRCGLWLGWLWGLASFTANFYWIYLSLHDVAGLPAVFALPLTLLFPAWLALFPALAVWLSLKVGAARDSRAGWRWIGLFPAAWMLAEWGRGWLLTGFPWGALGYSQMPESPLAGYAAVTGVFGVSWLVAASGGALAWLVGAARPGATAGHTRRAGMALVLAAVWAVWAGGAALKSVEWTRPSGEPVSVALAQGNIPQTMKWDPAGFELALTVYAQQVAASRARLVVLPETAFPLMYDEMPIQYLALMRDLARQNGAELVSGVPTRLADGGYLNSVVNLTGAPQIYSKNHLVPFGEFVPLPWLTGWLYRFMDMPLAGFSRGGATQAPLALAGQRIAFNICYEDSFGEELIGPARQATLLANVSNMAWFGNSNAAEQHLQLAQTRALETARPMLRATNTGMTAIIDHRGAVLGRLPQFERGVLHGMVQGRSGDTPYMRLGNLPVLLAALVLALLAAWRSRR